MSLESSEGGRDEGECKYRIKSNMSADKNHRFSLLAT
jgi:hypothetical protein